jgi:hypothetical protein
MYLSPGDSQFGHPRSQFVDRKKFLRIGRIRFRARKIPSPPAPTGRALARSISQNNLSFGPLLSTLILDLLDGNSRFHQN